LIRQAVRLALVVCVVGTYFIAAPFGYGAFMLLHRFRAKFGSRAEPRASTDRGKRARLLQGIMRRAFALMHDTLRLVGLLDFDPRALRGRIPPGPAVLVANHPTLCDVTSTIAAFEDVTTAVKPQIFRRTWLRALLEDARFFEGAGGPFGSHAVIDAGVARIREGFRVLVFPEGTRSPAGSLHSFGRAAFEIACQTDVPVIPVVIRCEPVWLSKEFGLLSPREELPRMQLVPLEPIYPTDCQRSSRKLRDVVEARLRRALAIPVTPSQGLSNGTDASIARASAQESHRPISHAGGR
jgi:1-acyl-sn-glycerol-3-phosphate acyltransferase